MMMPDIQKANLSILWAVGMGMMEETARDDGKNGIEKYGVDNGLHH